jgi:hypothetical protein
VQWALAIASPSGCSTLTSSVCVKQQEGGNRQKGMRRSEWMLRLLAVALTFSHVSAAPWTYEACNPNPGDGQNVSCCIWSGDSDGASMHPQQTCGSRA